MLQFCLLVRVCARAPPDTKNIIYWKPLYHTTRAQHCGQHCACTCTLNISRGTKAVTAYTRHCLVLLRVVLLLVVGILLPPRVVMFLSTSQAGTMDVCFARAAGKPAAELPLRPRSRPAESDAEACAPRQAC